MKDVEDPISTVLFWAGLSALVGILLYIAVRHLVRFMGG
jgi:hypothetical protein